MRASLSGGARKDVFAGGQENDKHEEREKQRVHKIAANHEHRDKRQRRKRQRLHANARAETLAVEQRIPRKDANVLVQVEVGDNLVVTVVANGSTYRHVVSLCRADR